MNENKIYIITEHSDSNNVYSREFDIIKAFSTEDGAINYCNKHNIMVKGYNKTCDPWDKKKERDYTECEFIE